MSAHESAPEGGGVFGKKNRSALAGFGEALLDALADHSTDTHWGQWLQAPFEAAATAGDVSLATALFKAGVAGDHLHPAIRADHGQLVEELLLLGASPTAKDKQGAAPIHVAALLGRAGIIKTLLKRRETGVDEEDGVGRTALHLACWRGHVPAVEALLRATRADIRRRLGQTEIGFTPFDLAARGNHGGVKAALLARCPDERATKTSLKSTDGEILHMASEQNNVHMIEFLVVEAGTDVDSRDGRGLTPLHAAARKGACQAMSALIKHGADTSAVGENMAPLHCAAEGDHVAAIDLLCAAGVDLHLRCERYFFDHPEDDTWSALDYAAYKGNVDAVKALVRHGADWKALSREGLTAMNTAAKCNKPEVIDLLIELGAAVDGEPGASRPLYSATVADAPDAARSLLRHGADMQTSDGMHETALEDAIQWGSGAVMKVMFEHGADPNALFDGDSSLLHMVFRLNLSVRALKALVQAGADVSVPYRGNYPIHEAARHFEGKGAVELLIEAGADVNVETSVGLTALQIACSQRDGFAVDALLRHGADMDVVDEDGNSPLHLAAAAEGSLWTLTNSGSDVSDDEEEEGPTGQSYWQRRSRAEKDLRRSCVGVLLRAGADETAVNDAGHTPAERVRLKLAAESQLLGYTAEAEAVLEKLARAPYDRAWRRRALWMMCRTYPDKVRLSVEAGEVSPAKRAKVGEGAAAASDGGGEEPGDAPDGAGTEDVWRLRARVLALHEEGIFRNVVGFL